MLSPNRRPARPLTLTVADWALVVVVDGSVMVAVVVSSVVVSSVVVDSSVVVSIAVVVDVSVVVDGALVVSVGAFDAVLVVSMRVDVAVASEVVISEVVISEVVVFGLVVSGLTVDGCGVVSGVVAAVSSGASMSGESSLPAWANQVVPVIKATSRKKNPRI